jgi:hypothetical protein
VISDRDIGGGLVLRAFSRHSRNQRLTAHEVLAVPVKNRRALVEGGYLQIYSQHEVKSGAVMHDICLHWEQLEKLDPDLPARLREFVAMNARLTRSAETIERVRWAHFGHGLSIAGWRDDGTAAGKIAADKLRHTPARGSAYTMLSAYKAFQKKYPAERRKRTWRRPRSV